MIDEPIRYLIILAGTAIILWFLAVSPLRSLMLIVAFQKVIDIFWFIQVSVGGFTLTLQRLVYSLVPLIGTIVLISQHGRNKIPESPKAVTTMMIFFVVWFTIGCIRGAGDIQSDIEAFLKITAGFLMLGAGWYYLDSEEKYDEFANLFIFSYLIAYAGVILQLTGLFKMEYIGVGQQTESQTGAEAVTGAETTSRYAGFYNDGATAAMYLFTSIPLCLYFIHKNERNKWLYRLMFIIGLSGVFLSFVRGTWVTMFIIMFGWLFINREYGKIIFVVGLASILIAAGTFFGQFFQAFFKDIFLSVEQGRLVGISGKAYRIEVLQDKFSQLNILEQFFGMGYGENNFAIGSVTGRGLDSAESDFYSYLYDFGILGWTVYFAIPAIAFAQVWRNVLKSNSPRYEKSLSLKYKVSFAMLCGAFFAYFGSGSKWVSFTLPLYFLLGFALKSPAFYAQKMPTEPNMIILHPKLSIQN